MFFHRILILLVSCSLDLSQAQQYILDPRLHFQPQDDYYAQNKPIQFQQHFPGFSSFDPYLQRDLQTSDVPTHLQKTLPQYRFSSKEQLTKNELPYHNTVLFRPDHEKGSQNVVPSTHRPNYAHFLSKSHPVNPSDTETFLGQVTLDNSFGSLDNFYRNQNIQGKSEEVKNIPPRILRQHTRILAPDPEDKQNQLQENKYFVNENGEVFSTTVTAPKNIFPPRRLSTKLEVEDENPNSREYPRDNIINYDKSSYLSKSEDQDFNSANNFDLTDYNLKDDSKISTTPKTIRSTTQIQADIQTQTNEDKKVKERINKSLKPTDDENGTEHNFSEPVVSVVTTKSVINNTIIATQMPPVTSESTTQTYIENSTDSWVVVASVQTSKSISGAHYLPSSVVAQEERFALLNEKNHKDISEEEEDASTEDYSSYEEYEDESSTEEVTTIAPQKHSTESLIDKLDRVQSDLSSGLLTGGYKNEDNNIAVITENMTDKIHMAAITESPTEASQLFPSISKSNIPVIKKFSSKSRPPSSSLYPKRKPQIPKKGFTTSKPASTTNQATIGKEPKIVVAKPDAYLPPGYRPPSEKDNSSDLVAELLRKFKESTNKKSDNEVNSESKVFNETSIDTPLHRFGPSHPTPTSGSKTLDNNEPTKSTIDLLKIAKPVDIKNFLPPGYKPPPETSSNPIDSILSKAKSEDLSAFLPPGYKQKSDENKPSSSLVDELLSKTKKDDISSLLPPGFKLPASTEKPSVEGMLNEAKRDDISAFLPPGFEAPTTKKPSKVDGIMENSKVDDISAFLPPGYKTKSTSTTPKTKLEDIFDKSKQDDISAFLPPGFKPKFTTRKPVSKAGIEIENLPTSLLPSGYKPRKNGVMDNEKMVSTERSITLSMSTTPTTTTTSKGSLKIVFPSRPGGKRINHKLTTSKPREERKEVTQAAVPTIHKGWPTRATTEFTGWPTPSTTPISIEKLLESVQRASPTSVDPENITTTTTTQTTVTYTTTTQKVTTAGVCVNECDLVGTIKLVDGVKWVPELLDRNTKEWQILANEVQTQLEEVYSESETLRSLFKNLRIDGFSEGSVLVDYLVEMQNAEMHVSTSQMKKLFNGALESTFVKSTPREGKALNETVKYVEKAKLGKFIIDPMYTDFIVVPKQIAPTVGYAEDNLLLPQWAIAVIVIGLASLLFVIIFGVTVLVNRSKNAKKKIPTPLTDDMLNELNKDHMGGYDNYGIEDPYSIEAGFWDSRRMDAHREYNKLPKKGSSGSIHDNSMTNLYDSWNSQNNGFYNNSAGSYYGQHGGPGSSHRLYERRRSYDTNF